MTLDEFGRRLEGLASGGLAAAIRPVLVAGTVTVEARAKANATTSPQVRTGRLRASLGAEVGTHDGKPALVAFAGGHGGKGPVPYASMQEHGGVQVPRNAKMLRIPLAPALTGAGVDRYPTPLRQSGRGLFFLRKSASGALLLFRTDDPEGPPWYVLKHSVRIPPRPFLRPAVEWALGTSIGPALQRAVVDAIRTAGGAPAPVPVAP